MSIENENRPKEKVDEENKESILLSDEQLDAVAGGLIHNHSVGMEGLIFSPLEKKEFDLSKFSF